MGESVSTIQSKVRTDADPGFERRVRELDLIAIFEDAAGAPVADGKLGDEADVIGIRRRAHAHAPEIRVTVVGLAAQGEGLRVSLARSEIRAFPKREHGVVARQAHA